MQRRFVKLGFAALAAGCEQSLDEAAVPARLAELDALVARCNDEVAALDARLARDEGRDPATPR